MSHRTLTFASLLLLATASAAETAGPPFELAVKKDHFIGASRGTLVFEADGVEYRTNDRNDARRWTYLQIKQVQIRSPRRIDILTYEDQGRLKFGADRKFEFEVTQGAVGADLVAFVLEHIDRSVVTAVMPPLPGEPLFRVPVKHQRQGRGSQGTLLLYQDRLVYLTERADEARHWRFADLFSVLRLDRDRLEVRAYEGGSGETRPFVFELKTDLPDGFYDELWQHVNRAAILTRPREQSGQHEEGIMAKDPVCGMQVDEKTAAAKSTYKGNTYYFCSPACKARFDQNPGAYAGKA